MPGKSELTALQANQTQVYAVPVLDGNGILAALELHTKHPYAIATSASVCCTGLGFMAFPWKFSSVLNLTLFKCLFQ